MEKKEIIFIVEDDPGFNMMMTNYLTSKNKWEIHSFDNGEECLKQLYLKPTIFMQDFDLPGINGIEIMKKVKGLLPETEFIFLSAQSDIKVVVEVLQLGAFDYIVKDINAKENALNKIDKVFKIKKLIRDKHRDKRNNTILLYLLILTWICVCTVFFVSKF